MLSQNLIRSEARKPRRLRIYVVKLPGAVRRKDHVGYIFHHTAVLLLAFLECKLYLLAFGYVASDSQHQTPAIDFHGMGRDLDIDLRSVLAFE